MGKEEVLIELNNQIKYHYRSMIFHTIGFFICLIFLIGIVFLYIFAKSINNNLFLIPLIIIIIITLISIIQFFIHKHKYQNIKLHRANQI